MNERVDEVTASLEWKKVEVKGHALEETLNRLSQSDYDIFSVQYCGSQWCIIARKAIRGLSRNDKTDFRVSAEVKDT
ncbi:MAG TPA: hypothetical protein PLE24_01030 [Chitinispirillaceae bacterium]|nr:hypothetical protein [Chitinispirillaceae bacterium]